MTKIIDLAPGAVCGFQNIEILNGRLWTDAARDLAFNNTYCPDIVRVIYNVGKKAYPIRESGKFVKDENGNLKYGASVKVLTTVVFFNDGTKVSVTNSENDGIQFEKAKRKIVTVDEKTGKKTVSYEDRDFEVATKASKEAGLVYAIVKRLIGKPAVDKKTGRLTGLIDGNGFGRKLNEIVDGAYDIIEAEHNKKEANAKAKAEYQKKVGTGKKRRPSLAESVDRLAGMLDRIEGKLN